MRNQTWLERGWAEFAQQNLARRLIQRAVHKDDRFGGGDFLRHVRSPLVIAEHTNAGIAAPALFGPLGKKRPDAVILAERIATSENETSGRKRHAVIVLSV
jgi:hypothetical protein